MGHGTKLRRFHLDLVIHAKAWKGSEPGDGAHGDHRGLTQGQIQKRVEQLEQEWRRLAVRYGYDPDTFPPIPKPWAEQQGN